MSKVVDELKKELMIAEIINRVKKGEEKEDV